MAIKAKFPSGVTSITLNALHQWDYGQELEIESEDLLSTIVEVHFSCAGMTEAEACVCSVTNGIATVNIPDSCLEQTANITAWVYEIEGDQGRTTKSITIPIIARARPKRPAELQADISNCYTQLITEVNEAVNALKDGTVTVKNAENAKNAETAEKATSATTSTTAQTANTANSASTSNKSNVLFNNGWKSGQKGLNGSGLYVLRFVDYHSNTHHAVVLYDPVALHGNNSSICETDEKMGTTVFVVDQDMILETGEMYYVEYGYLNEDAELKLVLRRLGDDDDIRNDVGYSYSYIMLMGNNGT